MTHPQEDQVAGPVKVSVVIPVYNPGPYIEDCIASLLRQSLPDDEYEAIFVDDGSTDETPARLDRLAAEHPHMRVIHQEASGWSGKPRNVGIEAARGRYVQFVDNDDWIGDEALEKLYNFAEENSSDVIIGKMAGINRGVPRDVFRKTIPHATFDNAGLMDTLTPHKMFRRSFLNEHGLRFPEGRRRLEDHVFVTAAYFAAKTISVYSDYVCYYHISRDDASNAGFQEIDWPSYFGNLREALDIVKDNTTPGALRDRVYRRWARVEMLERLRSKRLLRASKAQRLVLFGEVRSAMSDYFGPGVYGALPPVMRSIAALVEADQLDDIVAIAEWESSMVADTLLHAINWDDDTLLVSWSTQHRGLFFRNVDDKDLLVLPTASSDIPDSALDATPRLPLDRADLILKSRSTSDEYFVPSIIRQERIASDDGTFAIRTYVESSIDITSLAAGKPLESGAWDINVRAATCGMMLNAKLDTESPDLAAGSRRSTVVDDRLVTPYITQGKKPALALDVGQTWKRLDAELLASQPSVSTPASGSDEVSVELPLLFVRQKTEPDVSVKLGERSYPANISPEGVAAFSFRTTDVGSGSWPVKIRFTPTGRFARLPVDLVVADSGTVSVRKVAVVTAPSKASSLQDLGSRLRKKLRVVTREVKRRINLGKKAS